MLESIVLITGVGELSGGVTLPHSAGTCSHGGEERIVTQRQDSHTSPTPDVACSSSWNIKETDGEPMIDSQDQTLKTSLKEMADE